MSRENKSYYTFQPARTLIAIGTLTTLLFTKGNVLFTNHFYVTTPNYKDSVTVYFNVFLLFGQEYLWVSKLISITCLILVISGYYPKLTSILHWVVSISFCTSTIVIEGGDQIAALITFLLIPIAFCGNRKNAWTCQTASIKNCYSNFLANSVLLIIQLQIAVIYLSSGVSKIFVTEWANGSAYYYWVTNNILGAADYIKPVFEYVFSNAILLFSVTWFIIVFEIILFGSFFSKNQFSKSLIFKLAILFHVLIFFVHGLFCFSSIMCGCLILYLKSNGKYFLNTTIASKFLPQYR